MNPAAARALALPPQEDIYRRLAQPAAQGPIPPEVELAQDEPVVVPVPIDGAATPIIIDRPDAIRYVRAERLAVLRAGPEAAKAERALCAGNRLWFVARWVDIESKFPVRGQRTVPFLPFPYQARAVWLYDRARRLGVGVFNDKSRQLGFSWIWMALYLHGLLFEKRLPLYATSHKQDEVDDGGNRSTTDCLFGKLRFMYQQLPDFLRADPETEHAEALLFKHLQVSHVSSGSFITGEAATAKIGRGSSYVSGLLDEFAHVERSEAAWASADDAIECPILNSTPEGEENKFADLHSKLARPKGPLDELVRSRFLANRAHWSEHPVYSRGLERDEQGRLTSPWYRRAGSTKTPEKVAAEYDIEYAGSLPGRLLPEFSRGAHVPEEEIKLDRGAYLYLSADHGLSDTEVWGLWQTDLETYADLLDEWHTVPEGQRRGVDLTSAEVAESVLAWLRDEWNLTLRLIHGIIPDPAGASREETSGQSHHQLLWTTWERNGDPITAEQWIPAHNSVDAGIESMRMLLRGSWRGRTFRMRVSPRCSLVIDSWNNYRRRITRDGRVLDSELVDWTNHAADMGRYFCHTIFPAIGDDTQDHEAESYASTSVRRRS